MPAAIAVSHVSEPVTFPSPQPAQSLSFDGFAPTGQQPSLFAGVVIGVFVHAAVHVPAFASESVVHASPSSQLVGHAPGLPAAIAVSQVSPASTTPLSHFGRQSLSSFAFAPDGQQPSLSIGAVIAAYEQATMQPEPVGTPTMHGSDDGQSVGHAPGCPAAIAVSQSSLPVTWPSPHSSWQVAEQPSFGILLPSSQVSPGSMTRSPHLAASPASAVGAPGPSGPAASASGT
jgi:hypothetical protein